jgi:APA family basic amino acid/polyamine antiporter
MSTEAPAGTARLGLFSATMLVMGGIIGVGIFFTPHQVAERVPQTLPFLSMWVLGGLMALTGAMTFAELAATFPREGGWFVFLREAFGPFAAFLFAWIVLFVISTGAVAVVTHMLLGWVEALVLGRPAELSVHYLLGVLLIAAITGVCLSGIRQSTLLQNTCMVLKLAAIAVLVFAGFALFSPDAAAASSSAAVAPFSWSKVPDAMLSVLFACGGWQFVTYIAPNVVRPQRTLPLSILLGVAGIVVVYLALNSSFLRVIGIEGLARARKPEELDFASEVAILSLGSGGATFLRVAMSISAFGVCVAIMMATPGVYVAMAKEGLFFRRFGELSPRTGAPVAGLLCQGALILVYFFLPLVRAEAVDELTGAVVFAEWIFHALVAFALLRLRATRPELPRPFKSWLYPLFPLAYGLLASWIVVGSILSAPASRTLLGVGVLVLGAIVYRPWRQYVRKAS